MIFPAPPPGKVFSFPQAFPAHGECRLRAAAGRGSEAGISAAVEKPEDQRKPERLFGHRKVDRWREAPDEVPIRRMTDEVLRSPPLVGDGVLDVPLPPLPPSLREVSVVDLPRDG